MTTNTPHQETRFKFGENWTQFLTLLDEQRILEAEKSLQDMLKVSTLKNLTFLDIGSGSGLFSLAARRCGAKVHSFDYDPQSVSCTQQCKNRFFPNDGNWTIESGSVLDTSYLITLDKFDIVYSWGVLHHTGNMWLALKNVIPLVKPGGKLFIALYNDQGLRSKIWWIIKKIYCSNFVGKLAMSAVCLPLLTLKSIIKSLVRGQNEFTTYKSSRGMSLYHDYIDWIGGFPFEVASVKEIEEFYTHHGFSLINVKTTQSWGNNEFVFQKND